MSYDLGALLSGGLFLLGLLGFLIRPTPLRRGLSGALMVQGAILLILASDAALGQGDGQALALLGVGLVPLACFVGRLASHGVTPASKGRPETGHEG